MNREQTKEAIKVMQAWVDGADIQYTTSTGKWVEPLEPKWNWAETNYQVKPRKVLTDEQRKAIKVLYPWAKWFAVDGDGSGYIYDYKPEYDGHGWETDKGDFRTLHLEHKGNPVDSLTEL